MNSEYQTPSPIQTLINFHDDFITWKYHLGIVVHSGKIRAFKFKN